MSTPVGSLTDKKEIADVLADSFFSNSDISNHSPEFRQKKQHIENQDLIIPQNNTDSYNVPITHGEVERVLQKRKNSAPGLDCISHAMLKNLPKSSLSLLVKIFNRIWYSGRIPTKWKEFSLVPILKPNKPADCVTSYRPITLASCIFKILEKIVNDRLFHTLDSNNFFNKIQCGFRKLHSTTDALSSLENQIRDAFINQEHCIAIGLDIQRAYETTWIHRVLRILLQQGLKGNLMNFLLDLHQDRVFRVRVGSVYSKDLPQENGICQGLSLSCTIF